VNSEKSQISTIVTLSAAEESLQQLNN